MARRNARAARREAPLRTWSLIVFFTVFLAAAVRWRFVTFFVFRATFEVFLRPWAIAATLRDPLRAVLPRRAGEVLGSMSPQVHYVKDAVVLMRVAKHI